jgi:hypothetical protein
MADVQLYFGTRQSAYGTLYDELKMFFDEGGLQAQVMRVVGPAATSGVLNLNDRAGSPLPTLRFTAKGAGAWSTGLTVQVTDGATANTFGITIRLNGETVEFYDNIADPATAVNKFKNSPYVVASNLGSATAAPNNNPAVLAATALSAGADDRASVTATHYVTAIGLFGAELGDGAVSIPGQNGSTITAGLDAHCKLVNNRIALFSNPLNDSVANLKTTSAGLNTEYMGLFAPWVTVSDGGSGTRDLPPEGYVAAKRAMAHELEGPWRVPAGELSKASSVLDLTQKFTQAELDSLDSGKVNPIVVKQGTIRLYGYRSLSNDRDNYAYLKDREVLNNLVFRAGAVLEKYVFSPIDSKGHLLNNVKTDIIGIVAPIAEAGGVFARMDTDGVTELDPGYEVDVSAAVNTAQSLSQNQIKALLSVRISPVAAYVQLSIVKVGVLSGL